MTDTVTENGKTYVVDPTEGRLEVKYGLPATDVFCRRCVISNQRPSSSVEFEHTRESKKETIQFDENGICDACRYAEAKDATVDWERREAGLIALCDRFRSRNG